ncbi:MAG: hypothetical protein GY751_04660 [Bacteroidetes bacterium]|nr:hypothetical protein [Bacteroidota bacterium]
MSAGLANMEIFDQTAIEKINTLGNQFAEKMNQTIADVGVVGKYESLDSVGMLRFVDYTISNSKEAVMAMGSYMEFLDLLHLEMMNRGVFFMQRGMFNLSTPMTMDEIDKAVNAFGEALTFLKPLADN